MPRAKVSSLFEALRRRARALGRRRTVLGNIDLVAADRVVGWVKRADSNDPLLVDLLVDGRPVRREERANRPREDVLNAGFTHGEFGFEFAPLALDLRPGRYTRVEIRASRGGDLLLQRVVSSGGAAGARSPSRPAAPVAKRPPALRTTARASPPGRFETRIESLGSGELRGWAVDRASTGALFDVEVRIDGTFFAKVRNDRPRADLKGAGKSQGQGGLALSLPLDQIEPGPHDVALVLPDGQVVEESVVATPRPRPLAGAFAQVSPASTAVIVPVYNAVEDVETCIRRLADHTPASVEILFIDDASPDPRISEVLAEAVRRPNTRVLRNERNLGFTRTVNRGIEATGAKDVIFLNSDARVTPGWIEGLLRAARARPRVGTVTAMSDRAGAFSAPEIGNGNALPPGVDEIAYARAFRQFGLGLYPLVPTGNGFCLFVRRACLDEVGALDAEAFPRGYGEENDFCMRAGRAGWLHVVDDCTYVFHERSKSFGAAKTELMEAGRAVIEVRYPEYKKAIEVFWRSPELTLARFRARQALHHASGPQARLPAAIFVVSTQSGGTPQTNLDLMTALEDTLDGWLLRCDSRVLELSHLRDGRVVPVRRHELAERVDPITHLSAEYDAVVADWIAQVDPVLVHIRHLGWHSLSLPRICKGMGKAVVFSFHDFYAVCPTVKLMDEAGTFCGGACTAESGTDCRVDLWDPGSFPRIKNGWVRPWRERFGRVLADCDLFVTTSQSARATILRNLPDIAADRFRVIPHGRDFDRFSPRQRRPAPGERVRILVPGSISVAKGRDVILDLLRRDRDERLEFHVLGTIDLRGIDPHPRLICHGTYNRTDFADRVAAIAPHLGAIFSIWDETYCHTLTELWSVGLPALVFDFPTIAGRVRASGGGWVLPHRDIPALHAAILRLAFDREEQRRVDAALAAWQEGEGAHRTTAAMAADYLDVYRAALGRQGAAMRVGVLGGAPAGSPAEARLLERTRNALDRDVTYVRMGPAALIAALRARAVDAAVLPIAAIPAALAPLLLGALNEAGLPWLADLDRDVLPPRPGPADGPETAAFRGLLAGAARLTVATPRLLARSQRLNLDATLLPDRLSGALWSGAPAHRRTDDSIRALFLGPASGLDGLHLIRPAFESVAADSRFRLGVVGLADTGLPDGVERLDAPGTITSHRRFTAWLRQQGPNFDFAVLPVAEGSPEAEGSAWAILACAALGLPVLGSDVPIHRGLAQGAPQVRLVGPSAQDWRQALEQQVRAGPRRLEESAAILDWLFGGDLLEPTLPDFDHLVRGLLAGTDPEERPDEMATLRAVG